MNVSVQLTISIKTAERKSGKEKRISSLYSGIGFTFDWKRGETRFKRKRAMISARNAESKKVIEMERTEPPIRITTPTRNKDIDSLPKVFE